MTTMFAGSFRYIVIDDGSSDIIVGPSCLVNWSMAAPDTITRSIGRRAQWIPPQANISYKLKPMHQVCLFSNYQDVVIVDDFAYAVSDWGLEIFDLTMPTQLLRIGGLVTPGNAQGFAGEDNLASGRRWDCGSATHRYSSSNIPAANQDDWEFQGRAPDTDCQWLFLRDGHVGKVVNLDEMSDAPNPKPISTFQTVGDALDVWVDGDTVYLSDEAQGFQILDFGRIDIPTIVEVVPILGLNF